MRKIMFSMAMLSSAVAYAGGLVTNSNQSASFLRNPARDAVIDIDGVYTNPAGVNFMPLGFHLGLTLQHPEQERNVTTTFPMLAANANYLGEQTRLYHGDASAPVAPSFQAAYVWDKWTASASFAFVGGGGSCEFADGIGSIESMMSLLPAGLNSALAGRYAYSMDSYMKGSQYYCGVQLGAGYKVLDNLSFFFGIRGVVAMANYKGYVHDLKYVATDATYAPYINQIPSGLGVDIDTDQSGFGITPVLSVDWKINEHWNVAAKYEFRTKMNLENKGTISLSESAAAVAASNPTLMASAMGALAKYDEKQNLKVRDDIPTTVMFGVQYSPVTSLRFSGGFHFYDDCNAKKFNNEQNLINNGTVEYLLGAEWDASKLVTVSAGWQNTNYDLSDEYMQDMSFNCSSNLIGLGVRLNVKDNISIDLGYMHNFYKDRTVHGNVSGIEKTDVYERENEVYAVGVNFDF